MTDYTGWLSAKSASRMSGLGRTTIRRAIDRGQLHAVRHGHTWRIDPGELMEWATGDDRPQEYRLWSEADVTALIEMHGTCSAAQLSAYLGRAVTAVNKKLDELRAGGADIPLIPHSMRHRSPFLVPHRAILLAKTCAKCGKLRDGSCYGRHVTTKAGQYHSWCKICTRTSRSSNAPSQNAELLQEITYAQASNEKKRYTPAEIDIVRDTSKSEFQIALELGRSWRAIIGQRSRLGVYDGVKPKPVIDAHWVINFPAAAERVRDYYRGLGEVTAPEALYGIDEGWTDDEAVA